MRSARAGLRAGAGHDDCHRLLAESGMGLAHDGDVVDVGMLDQQALQLERVDVDPASPDDVLEPADISDVAVVVDRHHVAGVQVAVGRDGLGGQIRSSQVAEHE